jgi:hypothetical protein
MHSNIAALASSLLETAGGVGSFFASSSQASANSAAPVAASPGILEAGWGEGLREAIRRSVQVSCEKPSPLPSPTRPSSSKSGVPGEGGSGDAAGRVCFSTRREDVETMNASASAAAACAEAHLASKKRKRGPTSERQREANRANAAKSTGPKTDEGKAISALNALQHGVCSEAAILPGESELELEFLTAELAEDYQPRGAIEKLLVGRLASITWKLRRLGMAEMDAGYQSQFRRREIFDEQMELMKILPMAKPPKSMPDEESQGYEIFADDFRENGKPGRLQQITQLEMKLNGQMLAVIRQLVQMKKLRLAEAKAGLERNAECGVLNAECQTEDFDDMMPGARNEAIREAKAQATATPIPMQKPSVRNEAIRTGDSQSAINQPQSGGSTIAWGASPRNSAAAFGSPEGATQDDTTIDSAGDSEFAPSDIRHRGGVEECAAASGAGAPTGDRLPAINQRSPVRAPAPLIAARNEPISRPANGDHLSLEQPATQP